MEQPDSNKIKQDYDLKQFISLAPNRLQSQLITE